MFVDSLEAHAMGALPLCCVANLCQLCRWLYYFLSLGSRCAPWNMYLSVELICAALRHYWSALKHALQECSRAWRQILPAPLLHTCTDLGSAWTSNGQACLPPLSTGDWLVCSSVVQWAESCFVQMLLKVSCLSIAGGVGLPYAPLTSPLRFQQPFNSIWIGLANRLEWYTGSTKPKAASQVIHGSSFHHFL